MINVLIVIGSLVVALLIGFYTFYEAVIDSWFASIPDYIVMGLLAFICALYIGFVLRFIFKLK